MAGHNSNKAPLLISSFNTYDDWCKLIKIWSKFTVMFLSLESETQEAALELEASAISSKDDSQYDDQTKLYKKDDVLSKFQTSETFKTCKTPNNISMI